MMTRVSTADRKRRPIRLMQLPARKRRVKLAKDVIRLINSNLTPVTGTYLSLYMNKYTPSSTKLDKAISSMAKDESCEVCAIGALFVADVMIRDRATVD